MSKKIKDIKTIKKELWGKINLLHSKKGFINAGIPAYNRLFGRDAMIIAWQLLDIEPGIARATLKILSQFQGKKFDASREEEPGKILHETDLELSHRKIYKWMQFPYFGSIDSTPLFLILFSFYFKKTKDKKFLKEHLPNLEAAANWLERNLNQDEFGFLCYERRSQKGLFHQGWKDSFGDHLKIKPPVAIVEAQGYAYLALNFITQLFKKIKYRELATKLKNNFYKFFWMPKEKYFALGLDGKNQQRKAITSNPGHLFFTGILNKKIANLVAKRLFMSDLWTPYGIRTHSINEPDFDPLGYHLGSVWPHDNWIIAQGLKGLGYKKEYNNIKEALLRAYRELGSIPELYGVAENGRLIKIKRACNVQAWSLGALLELIYK